MTECLQPPQSANRQFWSLLDTLPAAAYTCDATGLIQYFNPPAEKLWGRAPRLNDPLDRYCGSFQLYALDGQRIRHDECWMAKALNHQRGFNGFEIIIERPDGRRVHALAHANPLIDGQGRVTGAVNVLVDLTAQKQAEEQRRRLDGRLQEMQKLETLGVLAGGIAHDFNNLLTPILGHAGLMDARSSTDPAAREHLRGIQEAALQAAALANQLLVYSGRGTPSLRRFRLDALVEEIASLMASVVSKKARLVLTLAPVVVEGDDVQLRQVLLNLVTNASEALDGGVGTITVRTGRRELDGPRATARVHDALAPGVYAFLEVEDDGCGMGTETQARAFEPYFTTKFTGRGLGLAAVHGIVHGHRGALELTSAPGRGTRVQVLLPASSRPITAPAEPRVDGAAVHDARVLVVDDEPMVRELVRATLEVAGCRVHEARDGREAMDLLVDESVEIDAMVLDLMMPRMDGIEVLDELQRRRLNVPVLVLSGYRREESVARLGAREHALRFLQKPFEPHRLVAALSRVITR